MKKITLTSTDLSQLIDFYYTELEKAQKRVEHINSILKKLSAEGLIKVSDDNLELNFKIEKVEQEKPAAKPKVKQKTIVKRRTAGKSTPPVAPKTKKAEELAKVPAKEASAVAKPAPAKRGRKPKSVSKPIKKGTRTKKIKWNDFILEAISKNEAPLYTSQIAKQAQQQFKVPVSDYKRVQMVIAGVLSSLVNKDKKIKPHKVAGSRAKVYGLSEWFKDSGELLSQYTEKIKQGAE